MMTLERINAAGRRKGRWRDRDQPRREWLAQRPKMVAMLPSDTEDVDAGGRSALDWVLSIMRAEGLYSNAKASPDTDCRSSIRQLVGDIRRRAQSEH